MSGARSVKEYGNLLNPAVLVRSFVLRGSGKKQIPPSSHFVVETGRRLLNWPFIRSIVAILDFAYDTLFWARHAGNLRSKPRNQVDAEFLLRVYSHRIEKAVLLGRNTLRAVPSFGWSFLDALFYWLDSAKSADPELEATLKRVVSWVREEIRNSRRPESLAFYQRLNEAAQRLDARAAERRTTSHSQYTNDGCVLEVTRASVSESTDIEFKQLVFQRHSVRVFADEEVPDNVVADCIRVAQHSPSACNRQAVRIHVYSDKRDIRTILQHQNGNSGFGNGVKKLLLVSYDCRAVLSSSERNLPYLDSGLFAMTLIYALESQNVASCCLNLNNYWFRDVALRRACGIPGWERPVLLIAIGRPPLSYKVPVSARASAESIVRFHESSSVDLAQQSGE